MITIQDPEKAVKILYQSTSFFLFPPQSSYPDKQDPIPLMNRQSCTWRLQVPPSNHPHPLNHRIQYPARRILKNPSLKPGTRLQVHCWWPGRKAGPAPAKKLPSHLRNTEVFFIFFHLTATVTSTGFFPENGTGFHIKSASIHQMLRPQSTNQIIRWNPLQHYILYNKKNNRQKKKTKMLKTL